MARAPVAIACPALTYRWKLGVADAVVDLQAVFDRNYEEGAYARQIDYAQEPVPPLTSEEALWANTLCCWNAACARKGKEH